MTLGWGETTELGRNDLFPLFFAYRLKLQRTFRSTLVEVCMTVVMCRSQQQGWRGQRIDARLTERQS